MAGRIYLPSEERVEVGAVGVLLGFLLVRGGWGRAVRFGAEDFDAEFFFDPLGVDVEILSGLDGLVEELGRVFLFLELEAEAVRDESEGYESREDDSVHGDFDGSHIGFDDFVVEV